ncbi:uroporphyrinogen decarboxylase, partial [Niallia nealsonii AAU1]
MKIEAPKIPTDLPSRNFHDILYEEDLELEMCQIQQSIFDDEVLNKVLLSKMVLKNCKFINTDFSGMELT